MAFFETKVRINEVVLDTKSENSLSLSLLTELREIHKSFSEQKYCTYMPWRPYIVTIYQIILKHAIPYKRACMVLEIMKRMKVYLFI